MFHLIAAYSLAAIATLAYVVAFALRQRRLRLRWSELTRSRLVRDRRWLTLVAFIPLLAATASSGMPPPATPGHGRVAGLVVDGSRNEQPLSGAEVVLRGVVDDQLVPIAETTSDEHGHFQFDNLEVGQGSLYVAGVNRDGVHYPGPRVGLFPDVVEARVRLVSFEGLSETSPLVALRHDIDLRVVNQSLEVTETLVVMNPTLRGYVGATGDEMSRTLELQPFPGFETITFHNEFLGRQFIAVNNRLATSLPWPPGQREVKFSYRLPIERRTLTLRQVSTLPCRELHIHLDNVPPAAVSHNLPSPQVDQQARSVTFTLAGETLAAGHSLELSIGNLSVPWLNNGKWIALGALATTLVIAGVRLKWTQRTTRAGSGVTAPAPSATRTQRGIRALLNSRGT